MKHTLSADLWLPAGILAAGTLLFRLTDLDLLIESQFYIPGDGWIHKQNAFWRFVYDYGPLPGILLTIAALAAFTASFRWPGLVTGRKVALFVVLLLLLGPGLIVNGYFKPYWGRPRPRFVQEFDGPHPFLYVWQKGVAGQGHSFPSGHASMGFFLLAPYFIVRGRSCKGERLSLVLGLGAGLLIGMARMVQGGHFPSDVFWAGGFVYFCGLGLAYWLRLPESLVPAKTRPVPLSRPVVKLLYRTLPMAQTAYRQAKSAARSVGSALGCAS